MIILIILNNIINIFIQAEDGIRDTSVTGVQTCALPISAGAAHPPPPPPRRQSVRRRMRGPSWRSAPKAARKARSEERRVGKECRYRYFDSLKQKYLYINIQLFN